MTEIPFARTNKVVVGIDPGASAGSITALSLTDMELVMSVKMPPDALGMTDSLKGMRDKLDIFMVFLEQVRGYVPKKSPMSMHSISRLCRHAGVLEGILAALGIPYQEIAPNSWHRALKLPKGGNYAERKKAVYSYVKQRYPEDTSQARCDSIAIAMAGTMKLRGKT